MRSSSFAIGSGSLSFQGGIPKQELGNEQKEVKNLTGDFYRHRYFPLRTSSTMLRRPAPLISMPALPGIGGESCMFTVTSRGPQGRFQLVFD